jgi:hypothetical protein
MRAFLVSALLFACAQTSTAQVQSSGTPKGCIDTAGADAVVFLEGRLDTGTSTGPYGEERFYVLQLGQAICVDDGGDFADPAATFSEVQVAGTDKTTWRAIEASQGRRIKVSGAAFAAHTIHHHRPLVVLVDKVLPVDR